MPGIELGTVACPGPLPMPGSGVALAPAHLLSRGENLQVLDGEVEPDWGGLSQDEPHCCHLVHVTQHLPGKGQGV